MRARAGERVTLFNGRDGEWLARIAESGKRGCTLECERLTARQTEEADLWLVFAPIKKTPADYLAQKATELGVRALQPVITRRTIVARVNLERMRANAVEAAEQSGRLSVPETREPLSFEKLLAAWPRERRILFCDEAGDAPPIGKPCAALQTGRGQWSQAPKAVSTRRSAPNCAPCLVSHRFHWGADSPRRHGRAGGARVWQAVKSADCSRAGPRLHNRPAIHPCV